jgi:hypothetical protein
MNAVNDHDRLLPACHLFVALPSFGRGFAPRPAYATPCGISSFVSAEARRPVPGKCTSARTPLEGHA